MIKLKRQNLAAGIERKYYSNYGCENSLTSSKKKNRTGRVKMTYIKSQQHDEYA